MYLGSTSTATVDNTSFIANTPNQWYISSASSSINFTTCAPGTYFLSDQSHKHNVMRQDCPLQCPRGTYAAGTYHRPGLGGCEHPCLPCPSGTFCNVTGTGTPTPCPAGTYGDADGLFASACSGQCAPGHFCPGGSTNRTAARCPTGRYRGQVGAASADDCSPCGLGQQCVDSLYIIPCTAGKYSNVSGSITCNVCPAGTYSASGNATCTQCRRGSYQDKPGQAFCLPCVPGRYSRRLGRDT